jgi:DNA polymerase (family 10)
VADLLKLKSVTQAAVAGSCRRCRETVGDLDVLATSTNSEKTMDRLAAHPLVEKVLARGETKQRVRLNSGIEMDLRVVSDESYGAPCSTSPDRKSTTLCSAAVAQDRGLKLNEYSVFKGEKPVAGRTEEEVTKFSICRGSPELREPW